MTDRPLTGIELITIERQRQTDSKDSGGEGWSPDHDDQHRYNELASAAACYATPPLSRVMNRNYTPVGWPFEVGAWKPSQEMSPAGRIKELTKAGALIAAEIDRLLRVINHG